MYSCLPHSNFLRRGGSPNTAKQSTSHKTVKYGYGMLHALITIKAPQSIALLLSHGANPNALTLSQVEEDKVTPAYLAASMGWLSGLETLIEAGADITLARGAGLKNKTALHVAAEHCHTAIVEYIVSLSPPKYHLQVDSMGNTDIVMNKSSFLFIQIYRRNGTSLCCSFWSYGSGFLLYSTVSITCKFS